MSRDPWCEKYTIWTTVAAEAVFTVRTCGTRPLYGPGLVHKSVHHNPRTSRSAQCSR
jgi:hypothetical protein